MYATSILYILISIQSIFLHSFDQFNAQQVPIPEPFPVLINRQIKLISLYYKNDGLLLVISSKKKYILNGFFAGIAIRIS